MTNGRPAPEAFQSLLDVSRETMARLHRYQDMLKKWNKTINLVSRATEADIWTRHFLDSGQLWAYCPVSVEKWLDLGSGGGFPGLIVAIVAAEKKPDLNVTLVESDQRKAAFLRQVILSLDLRAQVMATRIEDMAPFGAEVVSARALAPLPKLLDLAAPHLASGGICLFSKGESAETELTAARKCWRFDVEKTPSITGSGGMILKIGDLGRV